MSLDRSLIKQQARALMKNKLLKLFITIITVCVCVNAASIVTATISSIKDATQIVNGGVFEDDSDYFENFNEDYFEDGEDFFNFTGRISPISLDSTNENAKSVNMGIGFMIIANMLSLLAVALSLIMMPLEISLKRYFVEFIRGKEYDLDDGLKMVFKTTFDRSYGKKFMVGFYKKLFTALLSLLFIVPGVIFHYSAYFAEQLICDYPEISSLQAIELSRKITRGHKMELFVLDLSFIGWGFLCWFLFPIAYAMPYMYTTEALFYENFRIRAIQTRKVCEDDFLSDEQRMIKYMMNNQNNKNYYNPNVNYNSQNDYSNVNNQNNNCNANTQNNNYNANNNCYVTYDNYEEKADYYQPKENNDAYSSTNQNVNFENDNQSTDYTDAEYNINDNNE